MTNVWKQSSVTLKMQQRPGLQHQSYLQPRGELHHLLSLHIPQTVHSGNTITDGQHTTGLLQVSTGVSSQDLFLQNGGHLGCAFNSSKGTVQKGQLIYPFGKIFFLCCCYQFILFLRQVINNSFLKNGPVFCSQGRPVWRFLAATHAAATFLDTFQTRYTSKEIHFWQISISLSSLLQKTKT